MDDAFKLRMCCAPALSVVGIDTCGISLVSFTADASPSLFWPTPTTLRDD